MSDLEKYRELYTLAWRVYEEEQSRANRHDAKAATLLSALTLFIGASGFFGKRVIDFGTPPHGQLQWGVVVLYSFLFVSLLVAWVLTFRAFSLSTMRKAPLNEGMVRAFKDHRLVDVYYSMALKLSSEHKRNAATVDRKMKRLSHGYFSVGISVILFALFCILYAACRWEDALGDCYGR